VSEPSDLRTGAGVYLIRLLYDDESPRLDHARWASDTATRFGGAVERMGDDDDTTSDDAIALIFPTEPITRYLFDNGDVIEDGHTVGVERWVARHEVALIAPERDVLDLDTGDIAR
jgi:hypothetical protein